MTTTELVLSPHALERIPERLPEAAEHALALVLSHLYGGHTAGHSAPLARLLRRYAHTPVTLDDGTMLPAPCPEIDVLGVAPDAARVLPRQGWESTQQLRDHWRRFSLQSAGQTLPLCLLRDLFPPELWPVLLWLIAEGPTIASARLELSLLIEAERAPIRPDRRHHEESVTSDAQLRKMRGAAMALMGTLVRLNIRSVLLGEALAAWQVVPQLSIELKGEAATDTTAPSRQKVRVLWQELEEELTRKLPRIAELGPVDAVRQLTEWQWRMGGLFRLLRTRALLVLIAVLGCRIGAAQRLRRSDFEREHRFPDGSIGPAIALRPRKTVRASKVHWKGLPEGAAEVIETYLAFMELRHGPFGPDDNGPLLHGRRNFDRPWKLPSMKLHLSGESGQRPKRALMPRGDDPTIGFGAHTFRSFAAQTIRSLDAHELLVAWRVDASQHWIAECLLDHTLKGMDALYGGASKDPDREHLSRIGARLVWELLTGDTGARRVPDAESFRAAIRARLALSHELTELGRDVDRAFNAPAPDGDALEALAGRIEQLLHAHALVRRERQAYEELLQVEREIEQLRHDPGRLVTLPDTAPPEALAVDLDAVEAEVRVDAPGLEPARRPPQLRDWLAIPEFRELAGVSSATVPRWLGQGGRLPQLPFPDGDPRNPWRAHRVPLDQSLGERRRRLLVAGISETFLMAEPTRITRLEAMLATPGPAGWSREHCDAPLVWPDRLKGGRPG